MCLSSAPVCWHSKNQSSIETSSFGSTFITTKKLRECALGLACKLRMIEIVCKGPAHAYGDNQCVLAITVMLESILKKKSSSLACHFMREGIAMDDWRPAYVNTHDNEVDLLAKFLTFGEKRCEFFRKVLISICGSSWISVV